MTDLWTDLLGCLDLEGPAEDGSFAGRNQALTYHRLFGGQLLAQFVRAAELTCQDKALKSLHTLFPRAGRADEPVRYEVAVHHAGSSFATLTLNAVQSRGVIATASASMHAVEDGRAVQTVAAVPPVPGPERAVEFNLIPWETRAVGDLDTEKSEAPEFELWARTPETDPVHAPALLAYATDLTLIGTALRPVEGVSQRDSGRAFTSAVTSHTLWFHRPVPSASWLLLRQHSPLLAHARSYGRGDVLTEDGALIASYAQESLVRFTEPAAPAD
ncbi:acyl-CoA thioesterase [Actinocorallia sp. A-T 12471]|uniref:acyl-CoA thioesterase n=1 Tax=Actinocorallia sp. A-T 12471 TaxID=3089813 RepID=UPI0029CBC404|nr:acyl-CoA thioesterase domain-containing protein [Actinocorallia sp. A-T 12471]MDX6741028.1 thioesterase family protein [Actinocorallia sp. A-T 12471]